MNMKGISETGPTVYSTYPRKLDSLTICGCNYKGSSRAWQPGAQPTEPSVHGGQCDGQCKAVST